MQTDKCVPYTYVFVCTHVHTRARTHKHTPNAEGVGVHEIFPKLRGHYA